MLKFIFTVIAALLTCGQALCLENTPFNRPWTCVSETSAVIYWQLGDIQKQGLSWVEFGLTKKYGSATPKTEAPRWSQFHRITDLKPNTLYHYRMALKMDGKQLYSPDLTFRTIKLKNAIPVPGKLEGPPFLLNKRNATYILKEDILANESAIIIQANNVIFDMDGHQIIFGNNTDNQVFGVHLANKGKAVVKNGRIVQGQRSGKYSSCVESRWREYPAEVCGVSTHVDLPCAYPIRFFGITKGAHVHHNDLYSRVTEIESRHYPGNDLLRLDDIRDGVQVHDNRLTEGCHVGIRIGGGKAGSGKGPQIHHNDIQHHQRYVNGYALAVSRQGADIHHNKVTSTGRGVHLTASNIRLHHNHLDICGHMTLDDMPQGSRPWQERRVELHGIKFEGGEVKFCQVHDNFMRIVQKKPDKEWDYVPATPLNIACYDPNAMNEVFNNTFVALTEYKKTRHGPYGDSGQWASAIYFVGMTKGPAKKGRYSIFCHNNTFISNHLFISSGQKVNMTIRIEENLFKLAKKPPPARGRQLFRGVGDALVLSIKRGKNSYKGIHP